MGPGIVLLLMPALACASIRVNIKASATKDQASAVFNGRDSYVISDFEVESFNLTNSSLKAAVAAYAGGSPSDVFVKSPTPWGDLYKTYNWSEVIRDTEVKKIKIVAVDTEKVMLVHKHCENKLTSGDTVFSTDVNVNLTRVVKKSLTGKKVSVNAEYNVNFDIGMNPLMYLKLVSHLDRSEQLEKDDKRIQPEREVKFALKPSQSAKLVLNATKVKIDVLIDYESSLSGYVATNYYPKYQGHHFWAYDVRDLMNATGVSHIQKSSDLVTIEYYIDPCVYVTDEKNGITLMSVPFDYVL